MKCFVCQSTSSCWKWPLLTFYLWSFSDIYFYQDDDDHDDDAANSTSTSSSLTSNNNVNHLYDEGEGDAGDAMGPPGVNPDDLLPPVKKLEKYAVSENLFDR